MSNPYQHSDLAGVVYGVIEEAELGPRFLDLRRQDDLGTLACRIANTLAHRFVIEPKPGRKKKSTKLRRHGGKGGRRADSAATRT
jgi:hypothetical protein